MSEEITIIKILADNAQGIIAAVSSIGGVIAGGLISARASQKNDIRKAIHAKRADAYFDFYENIERVLNNRSLVFDEDYFETIVESKAKIKLLASTSTYTAFENFYKYIRQQQHEYTKYCEENDPYSNPDNFEMVDGECGEVYPQYCGTEQDDERFEFAKRRFRTEHAPDVKTIRSYITPLYEAMRKDLGNAEE